MRHHLPSPLSPLSPLFWLLFSLLFLAKVQGGSYTSNSFSLDWGVSGDEITFRMSAPTLGYVSFALSANGPSPHLYADSYVGWVTPGLVTLLDGKFPAGRVKPNTDTVNSATLMAGWEEAGRTTIIFKRKLNTGDAQDVVVTTGNMRVLWATSPNDGDGTSFVQHNRDGGFTANFLANPNPPPTTSPPPALPTPTPKPSGAPGTGIYVSSSGTFKLEWVMKTATTIQFTMSGQTTGWVSFGISTTGTPYPHQNADIYTGWVVGTTVTLLDTQAPNSQIPAYDATQSLQLVSGSESGGWTVITFTRTLTAADPKDVAIVQGSMKVLYATGSTDGTGTTNYPKHSRTGTASINFLDTTQNTNPGTGTDPGSDPSTDPSPTSSTPSGFTGGGGSFSLTWVMDKTAGEITFTMTAKTTGWISFGISTTGAPSPHQNADVYVGWVSGTQVTLLDCSAPTSSIPTHDSVQGLTLISGTESGGSTTIVFKRTLAGTGEDVPLTDTSLSLLWAFGDSDGSGPEAYSKHSRTGLGKVNFFTASNTSGGDVEELFRTGEILIIATTVLFMLFVLARLARKALKGLKVRLAIKNGKVAKSVRRDPVRSSTIINRRSHYYGNEGSLRSSRRDIEGSPSGNMRLEPTRRAPNPPSVSYSRQSSKIESGSTQHILEQTAGVLGAKSTGSTFSNFLRGVRMYRLPGTQISIDHLMVASLFLAMNAIALYFGRGSSYATKTGSLAAANSLLVAIPATRNSVLVFLLGIPFDRVIMFHRWMGYWTLLVNCAHFALELAAWGMAKQDMIQLTFYEKSNLYGFLGWACGIILFLSSIAIIRRRHFEWFFYLHFTFLAYYIFAALHSAAFFPYAIAAAAFYSLDRLIRLIWGLWPSKATLVVKGLEYGDREYQIIQVIFPKNPLGVLFKVYSPGQYLFVNFPGVSLLEWHPFSISSGPDEETLELHIRSLGDHTNKLLEAAKLPGGARKWIRVDGPYGDLNLNLRRFPNLVLASGGIGFSPVIGMLKDLYRVGRMGPKVVPFPTHVMQNIYILWVARSPGQCTWFQKEIEAFSRAAEGNNLPAFHADIFISGAQPNDQAFLNLRPIQTSRAEVLFYCGRPDFEQYTNRAISVAEANMVFVCGPEQMVSSLWDNCTKASRKGASIHFHHEIFEF